MVRRGRLPSATDISVNVPSTVANVAPYMLTAVRNGEPVWWLTSVPSAKPDKVLAATVSAKLTYRPVNSLLRSRSR
jgi:hypothetical protein